MFLVHLLMALTFHLWANEGCLTTSEIEKINPPSMVEPVYWNMEIKRGFQTQLVSFPESKKLYFNLRHCQDGHRKPSGKNLTDFKEWQCERIGELWLPVTPGDARSRKDKQMLRYFVESLGHLLDDKISSLELHPNIITTLFSIKQAYLGVVAYSMYRYASLYKPTTPWRGFRRNLTRISGAGFFAYLIYETTNYGIDRYTPDQSEVEGELHRLLNRLDSQSAMIFDGVSPDEHLSLNGMDILENATRMAYEDTQIKFCAQ